MKILVIGSKGNMGRRYMAILKYLGIDHVGVDQGDLWPDDFDKAIVCTPTDTHYDMCVALIGRGKPFLCEKPVSKDLRQVEDLERLCKEQGVDGYMVSNWKFVNIIQPEANKTDIRYDFYNTGKDGFAWDMIQLIYLSTEDLKMRSISPYFYCYFGLMPITQADINGSYVSMIVCWLQDMKSSMWTMTDAVAATKKVIKYMEEHNSHGRA